MKKILVLILAAFVISFFGGLADADQCGFADVDPGFWAEDYICAIFHAGITSGCALNPLRYCPHDPVNRAQMAGFLVRAFLEMD